MIPERLVEFINGPVAMSVGTRDEKLNPHANLAMGAIVNQDRETITFYIPEIMSEKILKNLNDNSRIALTISEPISHETYQFKGAYVSSRKSEEKDIAFQEDFRDKLISLNKKFGRPEKIVKNFVYKPSMAVTFRVEDIFNQTPGPGAGKKITE